MLYYIQNSTLIYYGSNNKFVGYNKLLVFNKIDFEKKCFFK